VLADREATLRGATDQIQDLAGRLIVAQETERKRLARELHDDLSQQVSLMAIEVDQLRQTALTSPTTGSAVADYAAASRAAPTSSRTGCIPSLEALGLVPSAVASVCAGISAQHRLRRVPARSVPVRRRLTCRCVCSASAGRAAERVQHSEPQRASVYLVGRERAVWSDLITDSGRF
jgi:hypothetical protein